MRDAFMDKNLLDLNGKIVGINLGYDFCAEHEWGIKGIRDHFGVGLSAEIGIDARKATKCPEFIKLIVKKNESFIICSTMYRMYADQPDRIKDFEIRTIGSLTSMMSRANDEGHYIGSMWAEGEFAFGVRGQNAFMEELFNAFKSFDIVFTLTAAKFKGTGLTFIIRSLIDKETEEECLQSDLKQKRLTDAVAKTGIREKLEDANCRYLALSPRWKDGKEEEVIFWLNPMDQQKNNYGWMTIQDLEDWINGKGKIPNN